MNIDASLWAFSLGLCVTGAAVLGGACSHSSSAGAQECTFQPTGGGAGVFVCEGYTVPSCPPNMETLCGADGGVREAGCMTCFQGAGGYCDCSQHVLDSGQYLCVGTERPCQDPY